MTTIARTIALGGAGAALVLVSACGGGSGGSGGGSPEVTITSPSEGADVGSSFPVRWDTSVRLGEPSTGRDHVHVFVDGHADDYTVVGGNEFMLKGLSPGKHIVNVTLQHADHSPAGAGDEVEVDVSGSGGTGATTPPPDTDTPDPGYGY
jgi:hypothetical protein